MQKLKNKLTKKTIKTPQKALKVALVHDYLSEYGGAERVLQVLSEMFPQAPIYTSFAIKGSSAYKAFTSSKIIESKFAKFLKFKKLYSPLRFLTPWIWESFDFQDYDLVISSASWYITKGILTAPETKHLCYCHTPPRYLYGYPTSLEWQKYWPVRIYANIINHKLRQYDYLAAQRVDQFIVNSQNVLQRVRKFYGKNAEIIYPPVEVEKIIEASRKYPQKKDYFLIVSRVVGAKGIEIAMQAANKLNFHLKIVGEKSGLRWQEQKLNNLLTKNIEFTGRLSDQELYQVYAEAKAFLALAKDEDFGMTVVEAQAAGTPVIAFYGGGYKETVVDKQTGLFFRKYTLQSLIKVIKEFNPKLYKKEDLQQQARRFGRQRFEKALRSIVNLR